MRPVSFPEQNAVFAKDQTEYLQLPAHTDGRQVVSCWRLTWRERLRLLVGRPLWITVLTFGRPLQPIRLVTTNPFQPTEGPTP